MSMIGYVIARILEKLRDGRADEAWEICMKAVQAETNAQNRDRLRLYLGYCGIKRLESVAANTMGKPALALLCGDAIGALKATYGSSLQRDGEAAVEAAILLGDLSLALRNHIPSANALPSGDLRQQQSGLVRTIQRLHTWAATGGANDSVEEKKGARGERDTNLLALTYRCTQSLYGLARKTAEQLDHLEVNERRRDARAAGARNGVDREECATLTHRWQWAAGMVLADFAADYSNAGASSRDVAEYLNDAQSHAPHVGGHPIGEGLWAAQHAGVSFDPLGCTLLASGYLYAAREHADEAATLFDEACTRFAEVEDLDGRIAALAARARLCVRLAETSDLTERSRWCNDAALHARQVHRLLAERHTAKGMPHETDDTAGYARELETYRNQAALYLALGRIEELRTPADHDAALTFYLHAFDACGSGAEPRELLGPLLHIGSAYIHLGYLFDAETALKQGLGIACDLQCPRYVWQFHDALSNVCEKNGDCPKALEHARWSAQSQAEYHREQMREAVARHLVQMELDRSELLRRQADERARHMEELKHHAELENKTLAARLGERAQLIEGIVKTVHKALKECGVEEDIIDHVRQTLGAFNDNNSDWREFEQAIDVRIPEFQNELRARAPKLAKMELLICNLMRAGASTEDICIAMKKRNPQSEDEMSTWKRNLDAHRLNILYQLQHFGEKRNSSKGAPKGDKKKKGRKKMGMPLSKFLLFFGYEPGDQEHLAKIRERYPVITPDQQFLCRHLRRGFSDDQIAEFYGIELKELVARYDALAALLGTSRDMLRDFLKMI